MSDSTPTQRFDAPTPEGHGEPEGQKKSRGLLIALIVIGAAILIAIIILLIVLLRGGTANSVASPTLSTSVSSSPTPTSSATSSASSASSPAPGTPSAGGGGTAAGPSIKSFTANPTTVACPAADAVVKNPTLVQFRWVTANVDSVEFGLIDTSGNYQLQVADLAPQGTDDSDLPGSDGGWAYPCGTHQVSYVLTATGGGQTKTAKVTVTDRTF